MTDKQAASKLMERVNDWESYLGRSETPGDISRAETAPRSTPDEPMRIPVSEPVLTASVNRNPETVATVVEVVPPTPQAQRNGGSSDSAPVIEVLPPDNAPRMQNLSQRHASTNGARSALFNNTRQAEAEYNHARRTNAVLSVFVVLLLSVIFTVITWLVVD